MKKVVVAIILTFVSTFLVTLGSVGMYLLVPLDTQAGGYTFSAATEFNTNYGQTLEMKGQEMNVLILTDQHYTNTFLDRRNNDLMDLLVEETNPELIILTGDQVFTPMNHLAYKQLIAKMDSYKIPWAPVFGNHDSDGKATKNYLANMLEESEYCLFQYGPKEVGDVGNYFVNITYGGAVAHTFYFLSSRPMAWFNYQPLTNKQVEWYEWAVNGNTQAAGEIIPSTLITHIPLIEYVEAYNQAEENETIIYGERRRHECVSNTNSGMFQKMVELKSTKQMFCGHDHENDYSVMYQGIRLTYAVSGGYGGYGSIKGGTLLTVYNSGDTSQMPIYK